MMPIISKQIDGLAAMAAELLALKEFQLWGSSPHKRIFRGPTSGPCGSGRWRQQMYAI